MFSKAALLLTSLVSLASMTASSPLSWNRDLANIKSRTGSSPVSFNNWGGHSSLQNFDDFNGAGNFCGSQNSQTVIVQEKQVVCHLQQIEIIQQRLVVLQEMAKKIITEQICEVETQTIVFQQFHSSMGMFSSDLQRKSGRQPGYDASIASHGQSLISADGSLNTTDLGFKGSDVGKNTIAPAGSNWNNATSPDSVQKALDAANSAANSTSSTN
ncbi:hypothetical protein BD779DRAFT_1668175 [Infundibulicybe gibba]|nr:hypothetical protein BD779DRAFT_1668175 [Infundibulicybe gibba]